MALAQADDRVWVSAVVRRTVNSPNFDRTSEHHARGNVGMVTTATLFIGLGNMGRPMAANLNRVSSRLFVYDANSRTTADVATELNAAGLPGLDEMPPTLGTVVLMLPNSRIIESVLLGTDGLLGRLEPGTLVIDMSSSEPSSTVRLAAEAQQRGIDYIDAPVSGGVAKAITGELAIMIGGASEPVHRATVLLEAMGKNLVHVGPVGTGHAAKALNNLLSATNLAAAAEVLSAAASVGIAPETMIEVINGSTSRSQASEFKYPRHILTGTFDSGFAMDLMLKDLRIAKDLIASSGIEAPLVLTGEAIAEKARSALGAEAPDHTELVRYYETANGAEFRKHTTTEPSQEQP